MDFPLGPVVRLCAPTIGGMGSILKALVRELRSCMLHGMAKKNLQKQKTKCRVTGLQLFRIPLNLLFQNYWKNLFRSPTDVY